MNEIDRDKAVRLAQLKKAASSYGTHSRLIRFLVLAVMAIYAILLIGMLNRSANPAEVPYGIAIVWTLIVAISTVSRFRTPRKRAESIVRSQTDIEAIPILLEMSGKGSSKVNTAINETLVSLLPNMARDQCYLLSSEQFETLCQLAVSSPLDQMALSAFPIIAELGQQRTITKLAKFRARHLASWSPERLACLDAAVNRIEERLRKTAEVGHLLLPSEGPTRHELLRPAGATETDEQLLLRPTNSGEN
jgi:hypothetical protein